MTLFKTIEELKQVVSVSSLLTLAKLQPYFEDAADNLISGYVGQELYDRVLDKYQNDQDLSDPEKSLLRRLRVITAKFGLAAYLPAGEVIIGDDGITTVGKGENRTAAYDNQVNRLMESFTSQAYESLERLLTWLEAGAQLTEFTEYAASEQYQRQQRGLVRKAAEFNDIYPIGGSRLTFQAIHPEILNVEEDKLIPLMGQTHYNIIKANAGLTDQYSVLRRAAQKAIVFQSVANVIRLQQNIQLDSGGLRVYATSQSGSQNVKYYRAPTEGERAIALAAAQARADFYWDLVSTTLSEIINPEGSSFEREILTSGKFVMF